MSHSFPLKQDDTGTAVADLQRKLASLDADKIPEIASLQKLRYTAPDGACPRPCATYGPETVRAVTAFQRRYKLGNQDGVCDAETWKELNVQAGSVFSEVWQYELDALKGGPVPDLAPADDNLTNRAHAQQLAGLAFSGGGIRSATFNLGILQALAELRLLRSFDYLSTVSGGGYIGAWFSRWLDREKGDIGKLEQQLATGIHGEADEIKFLRQYTNYMTPRTVFFSADTWALLATWVRNATLNLAIMVAVLAAVMVVPRLLVVLVNRANHEALASQLGWQPPGLSWFSLVALGCVLWSVAMIAENISAEPDRDRPQGAFFQRQLGVFCLIVVPLMVAGFTGSVALWDHREAIARAVNQPDRALLIWLVVPGCLYFVAWAAGWGAAQRRNFLAAGSADEIVWGPVLRDAAGHLLCAVIGLGIGTIAVLLVTTWLAELTSSAGSYGALMAGAAAELALVADPDRRAVVNMTVPVVAFGMPILLTIFGFTMVLCVGLVGRGYTDRSREWWSRQSGWTTIIVAGWVAFVAVSLYAPAALAYAHAHSEGWLTALLATSWFGTTVLGLVAGRSSTSTGLARDGSRLDAVARVAPLVFSIGALCLVATALHHALPAAGVGPDAQFLRVSDTTPWSRVLFLYDLHTLGGPGGVALLAVALSLFLGGLLLAWRVDINKFSLHMMYRNRLVRAYLGAINIDRAAHPFTGFDPKDDVQMSELLTKDKVSRELQRPYHIVNTALNLVKGKELAWQTRKAAGFAFTPGFCGYELPRMASPGGAPLAQEATRGCFRATSSYIASDKLPSDDDGGIHLGMAMAVSGAAASPNMGFHSSPPLTFLMTLFNVRLGRWFVNPSKLVKRSAHTAGSSPAPQSTSPSFGFWYLLSELFGLTDATSNFLYLSDGGHFENLGIYELVRRRCRLVVVVDAGADGQFDFSDLGNAIRKCGTDLNVEIDIDVSKIDVMQPAQFSKAHCVTGHIRYDKVDAGGVKGTLLYIKPSLLGSEYADILNYRKTNKTFPHQSTLDQWFDETQFETYRSLGYDIGKIVLDNALKASKASKRKPEQYDIASLCTALHSCWNNGGRSTDDALAKKLFLVGDRRVAGDRRHLMERAPTDRRETPLRA